MLLYVFPCILVIIQCFLFYKKQVKRLWMIPILLVIIATAISINVYFDITSQVTSLPVYWHILSNIWLYLLAFIVCISCLLISTKKNH